ncbi:MAG: GntR family transcriptional regulator [Mycobacterium sp.]|uniref:GntR family transcriptional regulator n=1 Tax=Mycobacterium sp. TaxID=1785 RepID=UPI001EBD3D9D|nr:GntR family transcriptional regulator [Mycobacterium sp.]MBW0018088.1 GntR family transcriptional regulator [Mycobacterium sp.]
MTQAVRRLERRSSGELVADHLRRQIIAGEIGPGERLTQEDIGAQLGVSRVPVREALVILEQEGWVRMEMHRGGRVLPIETSIGDNAEVWNLIFGLVARRAAGRLTPELDTQLADIARQLDATKDAAAVWDLCEAYLDVLFEAASAPAVARTLRRVRTMAVDSIFDVVPETLEVSRLGTLAVIKAVRAHDGERAVAAHDDMQAECLRLLVSAFERRDPEQPA